MPCIIDRSAKLIFIHVPKTGGSSIADYLYNPNHKQVFPGWHGHIRSVDIRKSLRNFYDKYFSFTVMREPFSWLVSLFEWRLAPYYHQLFPELINTTKSFELFIDNFFDSGVPTNEKLQSYWFVSDGKVDVDVVWDFENFEEKVTNHFNLPHPFPIKNKGHYQHKDHYNSQTIIDKATQLLAPDLELYEKLFGKRWKL